MVNHPGEKRRGGRCRAPGHSPCSALLPVLILLAFLGLYHVAIPLNTTPLSLSGGLACKDACDSRIPLFCRVSLGHHGCNRKHLAFWSMPQVTKLQQVKNVNGVVLTFFSEMGRWRFREELRKRTAEVVSHPGFPGAVEALAIIALRERVVSEARAHEVILGIMGALPTSVASQHGSDATQPDLGPGHSP
jgi:hypothetical protein